MNDNQDFNNTLQPKTPPPAMVNNPKKKSIWVWALIVMGLFVLAGFAYYEIYKSPQTGNSISQQNANALKVQYREKITLPNINNNDKLVNYQAFIKLDTLSLIQDHKLSLDCSNIYFKDAEGTKIPFWLADGQCYNKNSIFWLSIPSIAPNESKVLYVYYGNESISSTSNFNQVFPQNNQGFVAGYFLGPLVMGKDFSGHGNNGNEKIFSSNYQYWQNNGGPTFNHWGCGSGGDANYDAYQRSCDQSDFNSVNFPAPAPKGVDLSQGTIEMWINPYVVASENYQKIISDSNNSIELGIQPNGNLYFYPSQAVGKNYNSIGNALTAGSWTHLVVTWNFATKKTTFYINGKERTNDIENTPALWTQKTQIGDQWKIGGFAFAGELSGLRIYSKVLSDQEIANHYIDNNQAAVGPQITLGGEELVSKTGKLLNPFENNADVGKIPTTNNISLAPHYSDPKEGDGVNEDSGYNATGKYGGFLYNNIPVYLVSKNDDKPNIIFGVPSHFDAYSGTPMSIKGSFLLTHVGLKINDPSLIKNLYVELGSGGWYGNMSYNNKRGSLFDLLIPTAYACGGGGYASIGKSDLNFVETQAGIYWYVLKTPILAFNANELQVSYIPNGKEGFLSVGVSDMIFQDENQNFVRIAPTNQSSSYNAYLAPEENGKIEFKQDGQNKNLLLLFENQGKDAFTIDNDSINSIQTIYGQTIQNINIRDSVGSVVNSISMQDIKNNILGKTIQPGAQASMLITLNNLSNNASYWITLQYIGNASYTGTLVDQNQKKAIHWTIGNDQYFYPFTSTQWADGTLYKLDINGVGIMNFTRPTY